MSKKGDLYVFEGSDGIGKSTLAKALADRLTKSGIGCEYLSFPGREDGSLGQLVYKLHHDYKSHGIHTIEPASLQVLHIAAHIDAIKRRILPALEAGCTIVLDRFWWSTWVYGLTDGVSRVSLQLMLNLEMSEWSGCVPTAAFLVTRGTPLREETSKERWATLSKYYTDLAESQRVRHPVELVHNEGTEEESLEQIFQSISYLKQNPSKPVQTGLEFPSFPVEKVKKN